MIYLTHLKAHKFKQLQEVELFFPERCCALVEGLNEAGKSTLFEAVYFALYGKGLAMRGQGQGDRTSLIAHRESSARVELGVRVGDIELKISRKINRSGRSEAEVIVVTPDGEELIRGIRDVNEEILARLNRLDAEALLSSCFVQQKKLGQLEEISRASRQGILLKLLNMDRVTKLKERFKWTAADERALQTARYKYRLAEVALKIEKTREGLERFEQLLAMAEIHASLEEFDMYNEEAQKARANAERYKAEAERLATKISQIEALDRIIQALNQNIEMREQISLRAREQERLASELARIDQYELDVLPSLLQDVEALDSLKRSVEEISSLEEKRNELLTRSDRLTAALESAAALAAPKEELNTLTLLKQQAEKEHHKLSEDYSVVKRLEEARDRLARIEAEIEQALNRKARLISAVTQAEALDEKRAGAEKLQEELTGAERTAVEARTRLSAAMRIIELRQEAEGLEGEIRRLSDHQSRLSSLIQDSLYIKQLRAVVATIQNNLEEARLRLEAIREELTRHEQSEALRNWAAARRDADTRARIDRVIAECQFQSDAARARKAQADNQEKSAKHQMLAAGFIIAAGLVTVAAGVLISPVYLVLALIIVGAGVFVAIRGKRQSDAAANEQRSAEADILRFERQLEGEKVRRQMLAGSQPRDLSACRAKLLGLGLVEPQSAEEAEQRANALISRDKNTVLSLFSSEQSSVQEIERKLIEQRERLRAEEETLYRQLASLKLTSAEALQGAVEQARQLQAERIRRLEEVRTETPRLEMLLPAQYDLEDLKRNVRFCEDRQKALDIELARLQAEISSSEKQIQELFLNEGAVNLEAAQALLVDIDGDLKNCFEDSRELERLVSQLAGIAPAQRTSAELYNDLTDSTNRLRQLETGIAEKQARIDAEQERISSVLQAEAATDLEHARLIIGQLAMEGESLAAKIDGLWEQDKDSLSRWEIPGNTAQAREALAAAASTVKANIGKVNEEIAKRSDVEQQKAQTETEIANYTAAIDRNHAQLELLFQEAGFESSSGAADRDRDYEIEILKETQLRRALENIGEIKLAHQEAIESKATELSRAEQSELKAIQAKQSAEMLLISMGVTEITAIDAESISRHLPFFLDVKASDRVYFQTEISQLNSELVVLEREAQQLEQSLQTIRGELDIDSCKREFDDLLRRNTVCIHATPVLDRVRENILQSVLPNTLNYMRSLLPLLTCGRYHDAELDDETYKIRVWDNRAGEYIEKDIFSGATQDQFSLALRLAFALATLPEGLGARPKFIFLDEPTAGFDGERREAFINLLKEGYLSERFDQIFLIAPEGIFNLNPLPDHVRIVRGRIMTDTLSSRATKPHINLHSMRAT